MHVLYPCALLVAGRRERAERRAIRGDLRRLAGEERKRQEAAVKEVVAGARVVAATLTGLQHRHLDVSGTTETN